MSNLSLAIVGLPNVGKSTLFNALVKNGQAVASNYPFCTIEPNVGVVEVPDQRLAQLANLVQPERIVPAIVEFHDIAGLIAGASKGEGLGNKFLAHIRETAALILVARCFEDPDVIHVAGAIDPKRDLEIILLELILADLETVSKSRDRYLKAARGNDKDAQAAVAVLDALENCLAKEQRASQVFANRSLAPETVMDQVERELHLLTAKPLLIVANIGESQLNQTGADLFEKYQFSSLVPDENWVIPVCAKLESELAGLAETEQKDFLQSFGLEESGLTRLVQRAYKLLDLETYFTAGPKEVRAWTIAIGSTAPEAAGVIHTDFAKGFIRAEVIGYQDFIQFKGESGAKEAGKLRSEGKEYIVQDGDVMHFRFNV